MTSRSWHVRLPYLKEFAQYNEVLHIGAGKISSYGTTLDISEEVEPDILADLNERLPIESDTFDAVYAFSILEHVREFVPLIAELHRVIRPGGFMVVLAPHFASAAAHIDPTHLRGLSVHSFDYFVEGTELCESYGYYSNARFRIRERLLVLQSRYLQRLLWRPVNRYATGYERHWCYMVRAAGVYFELTVVK